MDLTDRVWELVQTQMPVHDCGRRLEPGWGPSSFVAVCRPCSTVFTVSDENAAQIVANARTLASREVTRDGV